MELPTNTSPAPCGVTLLRHGESLRRISVAAPACAPSSTARASTLPWASAPPMGCRWPRAPAGSIPLFLLKTKKCTVAELETILDQKSGLLGLSGISGDMRVLRGSKSPAAAVAIDHLIYNIVKLAGAYAAVLGGLDAFVFTAGIGENDAQLRAQWSPSLDGWAQSSDPEANDRNGPRISTEDSKISVWVIPTNEELMIARHAAALVSAQGR
jgi:acetate kinase